MTPDEVVKELQKELEYQRALLDPRSEDMNKGSEKLAQAIQSAISLIQDYQKLRERVSVEGVENIIYDKGNWETLYASDIDVKNIAKQIVTYLQQPTEHIER